MFSATTPILSPVTISREPVEPGSVQDEGTAENAIRPEASQSRRRPRSSFPAGSSSCYCRSRSSGLWALARAAHTVLLIVVIAVLVALILNPLVKQLVKRRVPRGLAILIVYLGLLAAIVGIGVLLSDPVSTQISHFEKNIPSLIRKANHDLANFQHFLNKHGIKIQIQKQGQTALQTLQKSLLKHSGAIVSFSQNLLKSIVQVAIDAVLTFVLSIYLLVYGNQIGALVRRIMPPGDGTPEDDYPLLVQRAVSGYVRGQLTFSVIMGVSAGIALTIFGLVGIFPDGEKYAVFFGGFYGLMEFVPYIGPIIGPAPAVMVALFNHPITAVWVVLLFVALQQLEGHLRRSAGVPDLAADQPDPGHPRAAARLSAVRDRGRADRASVHGRAARDRALPAPAHGARAWLVTTPGANSLRLDPDRCPDCGAAHAAEDAFCRSCGASLEPRVSAER